MGNSGLGEFSVRVEKLIPWVGNKYRLTRHYPRPRYGVLVEPFCGGACYGLHYADREVLLYDVDEGLCALWEYLIGVSSEEVLRLPLISPSTHIDDLRSVGICEEAVHLIHRWMNSMQCKSVPSNKFVPPSLAKALFDGRGTAMSSIVWGSQRREKVAYMVERIKHWKVECKSYTELDVGGIGEATWFVDPPYASSISKQAYKNHLVDYGELGTWCRGLPGQAIVCENTASESWLPFRKFMETKGGRDTKDGKKKRSQELMWCSDERDYNMRLL